MAIKHRPIPTSELDAARSTIADVVEAMREHNRPEWAHSESVCVEIAALEKAGEIIKQWVDACDIPF